MRCRQIQNEWQFAKPPPPKKTVVSWWTSLGPGLSEDKNEKNRTAVGCRLPRQPLFIASHRRRWDRQPWDRIHQTHLFSTQRLMTDGCGPLTRWYGSKWKDFAEEILRILFADRCLFLFPSWDSLPILFLIFGPMVTEHEGTERESKPK